MGGADWESGPQDGDPARAVLITGTMGVGKTTVAEALGELLAQRGVANAVIDMDSLRQAWPSPPEDPFNMRLALRNLANVSAKYVGAGVTRLVLAGVIEASSERRAYESALDMPLTVVRLRGDLDAIRHRLEHRHGDNPPALQWHLQRAPALRQFSIPQYSTIAQSTQPPVPRTR
jgi:adenylylsulfate kinase-like enzyme